MSVIGSLSDFDSITELADSIEPHFRVEAELRQLLLLTSRQIDTPYVDDELPIWFTTGRKSEDIPETIDAYLQSNPDIGRLWISKTEMEKPATHRYQVRRRADAAVHGDPEPTL